jgi:predicted membrane-bound dolichyl-phosphate-mannose-protein mannosyltransferase
MNVIVALIVPYKTEISWAGVAFAFVAAILWGMSAAVNLPVIGSSYGAIANLDPFYSALKKVARLNMLAAVFAALSALFQAVVLALPGSA